MKWSATVLFLGAATATGLGLSVGDAPAPAAAAGPAAPASEPAGLETLHIKFEIMNFNYYDLTKETCPEKIARKTSHKQTAPVSVKKAKADDKGEEGVKKKRKSSEEESNPSGLPWMAKKDKKKVPAAKPVDTKPTPESDVDVTGAVDAIHGNSDTIAKEVQKGLGSFGTQQTAAKPPWMKKKKKAEASFVQLDARVAHLDACVASRDSLGETTSTECTTIMDVLRTTIKETVQGIISCLYLQSIYGSGPAPGPASTPAAAPLPPASLLPAASFLHLKPTKSGPAPAPAPGPSPSGPQMPDVNIFVTFSPGRKIGAGKSTIVEIAFLDKPGNGVDDVALALPFLEMTTDDGLMVSQLAPALKEVTGIAPKMHKVTMKAEMIHQWDVNKCEKHIKAIVDEFTLHYTRSQVPSALYNECTNFMTRMSFSHDYVLDPMDTLRCKRATKKFAKHWNYGKNAEEKDFEQMCVNACEAKYGLNAPTCNIHAGDGLSGQPLL